MLLDRKKVLYGTRAHYTIVLHLFDFVSIIELVPFCQKRFKNHKKFFAAGKQFHIHQQPMSRLFLELPLHHFTGLKVHANCKLPQYVIQAMAKRGCYFASCAVQLDDNDELNRRFQLQPKQTKGRTFPLEGECQEAGGAVQDDSPPHTHQRDGNLRLIGCVEKPSLRKPYKIRP
jgi:hypothetical protein